MMVAQLNDPDPAWWKAAEGITMPVLVLAGGPTSGLPQDGIADLARRLPRGRLVTIPVGHGIHNERPAEFCAVIRDFLINR